MRCATWRISATTSPGTTSPDRADRVLERIEKAFGDLSGHPRRGRYPNELPDIGIREYREVVFTPYRIVCRVSGNDVYVPMIADGRRDMRTLPERRLLQA